MQIKWQKRAGVHVHDMKNGALVRATCAQSRKSGQSAQKCASQTRTNGKIEESVKCRVAIVATKPCISAKMS